MACIVGEICQTSGMFIGTLLSNDVVSAALVTMATTLPQIMFAGFLVRLSGMPWFYQPLSYLSYLRYAFESLVIAVYGFDRCAPKTGPSFIDELVNAQDPQKLAKSLFEQFNVTKRDTFRFANLLDVDSMCLEDVVNKSMTYLGVGAEEDYDTDYPLNETAIEDGSVQNPSYILSYYELYDNLMYYDIACLIGMLLILKVSVYIVLRVKTQVTK